MKNSFFLVLPEQREDPVSSKMYDEAALRQWIDELPIADVSLSTRLLHDFIAHSNKLVMSAQKRMVYLEIIRSSYLVIEENLYSRIMMSGFPKRENEHKIYNVLINIERELAIGYWSIVKKQTRRELSWFQGKEAALAIQRVIKALSSIVISQYMMKMPIHEWVWIDLHSLYKLGAKIKKESTKVADESCSINRSSSIQDSYKQITLLSLANPPGLMPKEILHVYKFSELIGNLITFDKSIVSTMEHQCIILQDEDQPAKFYQENKKIHDEAVLYIDFNKLYKAFLKKEKFSNDADGRYCTTKISSKADKLPVDLLKFLEERWDGVPLEGANIFIDRLNRHFVVGLSAAYSMQNTYDEDLGEPAEEYIATSASDSALIKEFDRPGSLSVGSLISFRRMNQPEHRRALGVVNNIAMLKGTGKLQFEITFLTANAHAVTYSEVIESESEESRQKALIYNIKIPGQEEKSFLIVDSVMLKEWDVVRLYLNEQNFPIVLRERKNIGLGYWQFDCRRLEEQEFATMGNKGYDFT